MPRPRTPDLSDWQVFLTGGFPPVTVRATSVHVLDRWLYLRDVREGVLFAAPEAVVQYVKRLESGEDPVPVPGSEAAERVSPPKRASTRKTAAK